MAHLIIMKYVDQDKEDTEFLWYARDTENGNEVNC